MACCGQTRRSYSSTPVMPRQGFAAPGAVSIFQYTGATSLTVAGAVTGRVYRFDGPGTRAEIDLRDQQSVARVPNLRRVMPGV